MKSIYLFLDDERNPKDVTWLDLPNVDWTVVRNIAEFKHMVTTSILLGVSFDHDLGPSFETGSSAARFLCEHLSLTNQPLPKCYIHSQNPSGSQNIQSILNSYTKFLTL
jgi:hypothetical protein